MSDRRQLLCPPSPPFALLHKINHAVAATPRGLDHLLPETPVQDGQKTEVAVLLAECHNSLLPPLFTSPLSVCHCVDECI